MVRALHDWAAVVLPVLVATAPPGTAQNADLTVARSHLAAPQDGGARRWQVAPHSDEIPLQIAPGGAFVIGSALSAGMIVTNYGCTDDAGTVWCQVGRLHGGPRGFVKLDSLVLVAGPDGVVATGLNDSAARAKRKRFDATGEVPCAQDAGQALVPCPIGVARSTGGDATAAVTFPSGFTRLLFFMHGAFISAAATMSGAGRDTDWQFADGIHQIRADDQRVEIPDLLLFGH